MLACDWIIPPPILSPRVNYCLTHYSISRDLCRIQTCPRALDVFRLPDLLEALFLHYFTFQHLQLHIFVQSAFLNFQNFSDFHFSTFFRFVSPSVPAAVGERFNQFTIWYLTYLECAGGGAIQSQASNDTTWSALNQSQRSISKHVLHSDPPTSWQLH